MPEKGSSVSPRGTLSIRSVSGAGAGPAPQRWGISQYLRSIPCPMDIVRSPRGGALPQLHGPGAWPLSGDRDDHHDLAQQPVEPGSSAASFGTLRSDRSMSPYSQCWLYPKRGKSSALCIACRHQAGGWERFSSHPSFTLPPTSHCALASENQTASSAYYI